MDSKKLRETARKLRAKSETETSASFLPDEACNGSLELIGLSESLKTDSRNEFHENAILLEARLRFAPLERRNVPADKLDWIREWVLSNIVPPSSFAHQSSYDPDPPPLLSNKQTLQWRALSTVGIRILLHLNRLDSLSKSGDPPIELITSLAAYTNAYDPWTTPDANNDTEKILGSLIGSVDDASKAKVFNGVLADSIKPLFAKSKNPAVTEQGRKVIHPLPQPLDMSDMETSSKPWKFRDIYIVTVYRWVLTRLTPLTLEQHWPLLIPPLLAIVDDEATALKIKGCELLDILLRVTPTDFLKRTGLGEVFEGSLIPYLAYLPTMTPEDESIRLLNEVYPSLILLAKTRFPPGNKELVLLRQKALDKIIRMGILKGYWHVSETVKVAEMLVRRMADVIEAMGILSVKHLKDLLPLLTSIFSAPLCLSYPPLLHAAANSLRILTLNAWPRIEGHRAEALKGLCLCWCILEQEPKPLKPELSAVAEDLRECLKVLEAALKVTDIDVAHEFELLRESNVALKSFFPAQELKIEVEELEGDELGVEEFEIRELEDEMLEIRELEDEDLEIERPEIED